MPRRQKEGIYERKDSPYWWASYTDGRGERVRRSTGVPVGEAGRQEAEALLAKWKVEAHQQRMWGKEEGESDLDPTFDEVMLAYIKGHKTRSSEKVKAAESDPHVRTDLAIHSASRRITQVALGEA